MNIMQRILKRLTGVFKRIKQRVLHPFRKLRVDPRALNPIIIFQSGKVGSSSIHASLMKKYEDLGIVTPVYHAHVLVNIDARIDFVQKTRPSAKATIKMLRESQKLRAQIDAHPKQTWNVINLVRDPVAIKVSALFQTLHEYFPNWEADFKANRLTLDDLQTHLLTQKEFGVTGFEAWYESQIKPLWNLDVLELPFSREKGYQIYREPRLNMIIFRLEDLDRVAERAFEEFIGLRGVQIINTNLGEQKKYAEIYRQFKERPLPAEYVDAIYATRFARHFYTDEEIKEFRKKWLQSPDANIF